MKIKISFICLFFLFITSFNVNATAVDSVGIKVVDGKKYIIHKLEPKETLYSLGKRYHVSVAEIQEVNPKEKDGYSIDQIGRELLIPYKEEEFASTVTTSQSNGKQHTVKAGETIYSISKKYDVSQDDLMKWNNLQSTSLSIGQELWVSNPATYSAKKKQVKKSKKAENREKTEKKGEIIHTVDMGETIYSISKQYDVKQSEIIELNNLKDNNIAVGQKLIVKAEVAEEAMEEIENPKPENQIPSEKKIHYAKKGETYKKVAGIYGLQETKLKNWNKFKEPFVGGEVIKITKPETEELKVVADAEEETDTIRVDKSKIHTVGSGETLYSLSEKYNVEVEDLRKWNSLDNYQLSKGQKLYIQNPDALMADVEIEEKIEEKPVFEKPKADFNENPQKQDTKAYFTVEEEDMPKIDKIKEKGVAEVIEGSEGTEKYLALHRTAKIGTIMQVRNDLNDQIVFVRVLGKLPNTGVDEKVIIRISKKAFEKLGGVDYKFPVEISYLPLKD
ncbi:LysM peptidoglycan-binding domain-containing protein [Marivirga salinae]|uniref:LysM peptidoglycan-binding domain-containing protein n=1 Tax=Marivirga salinarum TaxID=3059078 RepID=A0AA51NAR9_9BACT|nr:LysM peptidoglycan-binding domain-containing protein [Marivirga sp. BDSF4-3]WMN11698.1 LysM peptidoglycan-binding domain-containing protein [Marivirga sp. BDSF4-3]